MNGGALGISVQGVKNITVRGDGDFFHRLLLGCVEILERDLRMTNVQLNVSKEEVVILTLIRTEFMVLPHPSMKGKRKKKKS